ncbi:hypothetical protein GCM10017744_002800 [Streptomyces antimycoticus]|uniref:Uncharacterized protein n=1 Tax=Streptomyces antimycoticus TaxID=68175 RepID=A0A4D4KJX1_9ACTN|nr:hypothetical protein [Streptomyces antimycoticus]GDY48802.1 hypothetical protein SANT12839_096840 [Streptomyces antimycoticus]
MVAGAHHRLALIWAGGGYTGSLVEYCLPALALVLAIQTRRRRPWLRRRTTSVEAMVYWSMIGLMTRRPAR